MAIGGAAIELSLSQGKAVWFRARFTPSNAHSHFQIETKGNSDTCLELYRDLDSARAEEALAEDDDSGDGLNARLVSPFGYPSPLYVKLEMCGRASGKVRLVSRRSLQEPAKCNSGGCVFATALRSRPEERELLALLRQVRDLLETTPEGRRLSDLYWDMSAELIDDVVLDSGLRRALASRLTQFLPAVQAAVAADQGSGDIVLSAGLVADAERLQELVAEHLSPETAARLDQEMAALRLRERVGTPIRRVAEDLGLRPRGIPPPAPPQTLLVKLSQGQEGAVELRRGILSFGRPDLDTLFRPHEVRSMAAVFPNAEISSGLRRVYKITLAGGAPVARLLQELRATPGIEYAELDGQLQALSNDVYYRYQYGVLPPANAAGGVNAVTAWNVSTGDPSILVAVVDTGVDYGYADLAGRVRYDLGYDYADEDPDPMDDHGHGTHVAGVIAASVNNSFGIAGIAPRVTIIPMRVLGANGQGSASSIAAGIEAAAQMGARIIVSPRRPPSGQEGPTRERVLIRSWGR